MSDAKLKPCPFCGGECTKGQDQGSDYETYWRWWIECNKCGATVEAATEDEVIAKWGAREAAELEALRKFANLMLEYQDPVIRSAVNRDLQDANLIDKDGNPTPLLTGEKE